MHVTIWPFIHGGNTTVFYDGQDSYDIRYEDENYNHFTIGFSRKQLEILQKQIEMALAHDPFSIRESGQSRLDVKGTWNDPMFADEQIELRFKSEIQEANS